MATYRYEGGEEREFPAIKKILKPGDTFEAPQDFSADGVVAVGNSKPSAPAVAPVFTKEAKIETPSLNVEIEPQESE
jgi:hypothetical protein